MVFDDASRGSRRTMVAGTSGSGFAPPVPDMSVHTGVEVLAAVALKTWCPRLGGAWLVTHAMEPVVSLGSKAALESGWCAETVEFIDQVVAVAPTGALGGRKMRPAEKGREVTGAAGRAETPHSSVRRGP